MPSRTSDWLGRLAILAWIVIAGCVLALRPFPLSSGNRSQTAPTSHNPHGFTSPGHGAQTVTISTATTTASISYTRDGSVPTPTHGTIISAASGTTSVAGNHYTELQSMAFSTGLSDSAVTLSVYDFEP